MFIMYHNDSSHKNESAFPPYFTLYDETKGHSSAGQPVARPEFLKRFCYIAPFSLPFSFSPSKPDKANTCSIFWR